MAGRGRLCFLCAWLSAFGVVSSLAFTPTASAFGGAVAWGRNDFGELGDGTLTIRPAPVTVRGLAAGVTKVAAASNRSLALLANGTVDQWGEGYSFGGGQPARDAFAASSSAPAPVPDLTGVVGISAGEDHSLALLSNGTVMGWGNNSDHQLGNDNVQSGSSTPVPAMYLGSNITAVAAGNGYSLAMTSGGAVEAWGDAPGRAAPSNGKPALLNTQGGGAVAIAAGWNHALALLLNGTVEAWGGNDRGQLGNPLSGGSVNGTIASGLTHVIAVAAGDEHSLALLSSGTVMAWGYNGDGQLGDGTTTDRSAPVPVHGLSHVIAIAAGRHHSLALLSDGTVKAWGDDGFGQLGNGATSSSKVPVTVARLGKVSAIAGGDSHSLAVGLLVPNTVITAVRINRKQGSARFAFLGGQGRNAFACSLTRAKTRPHFSRCQSPIRYPHLRHGSYTFTVRASNPAGADPTPARRAFRI